MGGSKEVKQLKSALLRTTVIICMVFTMWGMSDHTVTAYADMTVYVTPTGSKYHAGKCGRGTSTACSLSAAKARGLTPCAKCFPNGAPTDDSSAGNNGNTGSPTTVTKPKLKLNTTNVILVKGKTKKLICKGGTGSATWKSSNKKVVSVTANGKLKSLKKGTAIITVMKGDLKKTCKVRVEEPKLNAVNLMMEEDDETVLRLKGCSHQYDVEWWSSDDEVCDVEDGTVYAYTEGEAWIYARVHAVTFKCKVVVTDPYEDDVADDEAYEAETVY